MNKTFCYLANRNEIKTMMENLEPYAVSNANPYVLGQYKYPDRHVIHGNVSITIYSSGKVVFQGDFGVDDPEILNCIFDPLELYFDPDQFGMQSNQPRHSGGYVRDLLADPIWTSDNGMVKDLLAEPQNQGRPVRPFQTKKAVDLCNNSDQPYYEITPTHLANRHHTNLIQVVLKQANVIGCDEVGVGDFFGGIVTACVFLDQSDVLWIQNTSLTITDSKRLTDSQILELYPILTSKFRYKTASFSPSEYNEFYEEFPNGHIAKAYLHNKALKRLLSTYNPRNYHIVMDEFVNVRKYYEYLDTVGINDPVKIDYFTSKAEAKFYAVAIASMIARGTFLMQMNKLSQSLGIQLPLGVNYDKIYDASFKIINRHGLTTFLKLTKHNFKTLNLVLEAYEKMKYGK